MADRAALISVTVAHSQTPGLRAGASEGARMLRGVHLFTAAFAGSKLYCLVYSDSGV